jgi:chromate transport protein ChrA
MAAVDQLSVFGWRLAGVVGAFLAGMAFFVIALVAGMITSRVG